MLDFYSLALYNAILHYIKLATKNITSKNIACETILNDYCVHMLVFLMKIWLSETDIKSTVSNAFIK